MSVAWLKEGPEVAFVYTLCCANRKRGGGGGGGVFKKHELRNRFGIE